MKKFLKYTGLTLLVILVILFITPLFFKGKILKIVKQEINSSVEAKVDFKDLNISWFRHFPKLTVGLEDVYVAGVGSFEGDTLLKARSLDVSMNIMSVISGKEMKVYGVYLDKPDILAKVNKEGEANWDIAKKTESSDTSSTPSSFQLSLEKYLITDGHIIYDDAQSGMYAEVKGLDHEGSGNFTQDVFTLSTKTKSESASFTYANIPYLVNAATGMDADIEIDNRSSKYSFKKTALEVNDLKLTADGFFQLVNDSTYNMDISFNAPSNDFKNFLSLIPAIYKNEFSKIKTSGQASLKGFAKGVYSNTSLPAYNVDLAVKDGSFQYPDLPQAVKNIQVVANFSNTTGALDNTVIDIQKAHLDFGKDPFDFKLVFKNPETRKYIDLVVKGKLDLAEVSKFIKLDAGTSLSGSVNADAFAKGEMAAIQKQSGPFSAGGFFNIRNFGYASKDLPFPVKNGAFDVQVQNQGGVADATDINVSPGHVEMGNDVIDFALKLNRPVTVMNFSGNAKGGLSLDKLEKFIDLDPGTKLKGLLNADMNFAGSKADIDKGAYDKISLNGTADLKAVAYVSKDYPSGVKINNASLNFNPDNAQLRSLEGHYGITSFTANGVLDNMVAYALDKGQLQGTINLTADNIKLNEWMGTSETSTPQPVVTGPFLVPANVDIAVNTRAGSVVYDKVTYKNISGRMQVKDEAVYLQDVKAEALSGNMSFNGSYSTRENKKQPRISMAYAVKDIDIQQAFYAFNTVSKLMPVGQFISGKMNSSFQMNGNLGGDMFPQLTSLNGGGNLFLVEGLLRNFEPLQKLATHLQVNALKEISLKDVKAQFEFANGKVLMKPFSVKVKDIEMQIGGTHGLDKTMDYLIAMKIPRSYLGNAGNNLVNGLVSEAAKKGVAINPGEMVNLNVRMTGSMTNPSIKTDLKQSATDITQEMKQQAGAFVKQKADSVKQSVRDTVKQIKNQVVNDVKKDIFNQITGTKDSSGKKPSFDSTKKKAEATIKEGLNNLFKKKKG
jgi:hypothetical protein